MRFFKAFFASVVVCLLFAFAAHLFFKGKPSKIKSVNSTLRASESSAKKLAPELKPVSAKIIHAGKNVQKIASEWDVKSEEPAAANFAEWTKKYLASSNAEKRAMETEGIAIATERRAFLKQLIKENPEHALELALPFSVRRELPDSIRELLEERVSGRGTLAVLGALAEPGKEALVTPIFRTAKIDGKEYQAFAYGRRLGEPTRADIPLNGIAIENFFAVNENPVRVLEPDEAATVQTPAEAVCSVSGDLASAFREETAVDVGGKIEFVCHVTHAEELNKSLIAAESGGSVSASGVAASPASEGQKKLLFIRVDFSDLPGVPFPDSTGTNMINGLNSFYTTSSYGRAGFILAGQGSDITPTLRMPKTAAYYGTNNFYDLLRSDAQAAAKSMGYVLTNYNYDLTCMGAVPGFNWAGLGYVGAPGAWIRITFTTGVPAHELGHNFGLNHANFWDTGGKSIIGTNGTNVEYGDPFDTMGINASGGNYQFNARNKRLLNWLTASDVAVVTSSGTYRIYCHDDAASTGIRALSIAKNSGTNYWVEFRQKFTGNRWMMNGARIFWAQTGNQQSLMLDTTPGSPDGKDDSPLVIGRTFADKAAGIYITPISKGGTIPESLNVVVNKETFPANQPPTVSVSASSTSVSSGALVTFTATASDPNGDTLAYYWDFGDGTFGVNSNIVSKSWTSGEHVVRCTVTDMKGGTASSSVIVRVGLPTTYRISGKIMTNNAPIEGVRVFVSNSQMTYTDSDGTYNLVGLASGSYIVDAQLDGYTFYHPTFKNPVGVGPSVSNIDFNTANVLPPGIVAQPQSRAVAAGSAVKFSVSTSGTGLTYRWLFNGGPLFNATNSIYTIQNAQPEDAGNYSVIVSNALGSVTSSNAVLTVNVPPVLAAISDQFVNAGAKLVFTNSASDSDAGQNLAFSISAATMPDSTIDSATGIFSWQSPVSENALTNSVTIRVVDDGIPPLSNEKTFQIIVVPPPRSSSVVSPGGGTIELRWSVFPGKTYQVQYKSNLSDAEWLPLGNPMEAKSVTLFYTETFGAPERFYRLVQLD